MGIKLIQIKLVFKNRWGMSSFSANFLAFLAKSSPLTEWQCKTRC